MERDHSSRPARAWSPSARLGRGRTTASPYTPRAVELPEEVSPHEAHEAITGSEAFLLDVREPWEWEERRIPGAVLIPLAELPDRVAELPEDRDIYVHCRMGGRSRRAVEFLRVAGRPRSANVRGGIDAWDVAGLPVEE